MTHTGRHWPSGSVGTGRTPTPPTRTCTAHDPRTLGCMLQTSSPSRAPPRWPNSAPGTAAIQFPLYSLRPCRDDHRRHFMPDPSPPALRPREVGGLGLWLREWTEEDLPVMVELFDNPEMDRWTPLRSPFDMAAATAYLAKAHQTKAESRGIHLAITVEDDQPRGEVLLRPTGNPGEGEIAYGIGPQYRRQGLAKRAVELMTRHGFQDWGMTRILLRIEPANEGSQAVAASAGFQLTGDAPVVRERKEGPFTLLTWERTT
ncbi:GNAT family N-acetyltransferase [Nonomuraea sp. NPDC049784]|uniref:GNAT family N-acetyltransferase n=1 Tax=Nonomuraea sp. NPDC049784 TaxID=3154361 RepID=UPI0033FF6248